VVAEFAAVLRSYGLGTVTGDDYAAEFRNERFGANGVRYELSELNRSEIYLNFLPVVTSGQVDLLDNRRMVAQFSQLERRTSRAGRDTIDHPQGGHDDVSNSVAGCIALLATQKKMMRFTDDVIARLSEPYRQSAWEADRPVLNPTLTPRGMSF
jgi:hypothetical protein